MPTDQLSKRKPPRRADDAKVVQYDDFIDARIQSTRRAVKLVDLASSLVVLTAGVLAFLLGVAVVEHWIVPGGFSTAERSGLFAILLVCVLYFAYRRVCVGVGGGGQSVCVGGEGGTGGPPRHKNVLHSFF